MHNKGHLNRLVGDEKHVHMVVLEATLFSNKKPGAASLVRSPVPQCCGCVRAAEARCPLQGLSFHTHFILLLLLPCGTPRHTQSPD